MKPKQTHTGESWLILGLGHAGLSVARFLVHQGASVCVSEQRDWDSFTDEARNFIEAHRIPLETGGHSEKFFSSVDYIFPSPGMAPHNPLLLKARSLHIPLRGELALAAAHFSRQEIPVIAITGSNGKTTVTTLIGDLLQAAGKKVFVGGNIGTPVLDCFSDDEEWDVLVLELSSFQLELAGDFAPAVGLLLNITPDHLNWHGSLQAYAATKLRLFAQQKAGAFAILGGDDPFCSSLLAKGCPDFPPGIEVYSFGIDETSTARVEKEHITLQGQGSSPEQYAVGATRFGSRVNRLNLAAALLAVRSFEQYAGLSGTEKRISPSQVQEALHNCIPPKHRMTEVRTLDDVIYYNDSKATNVGAMHAALLSCEQPVVLIAGGRDKDGDFSVLTDIVSQRVKGAVLIGEASQIIAQAFQDKTAVHFADTMENAVRLSQSLACAGDIVLLAPGCASFDMFTGYAQRGDVFSAAVASLEGKEKGESVCAS